MAIDPYLIATAIFGPASAVLTIAWIGARNSARIAWEAHEEIQANASILSREYLSAKAKLAKLEQAERRRKDHLKAISRKGQAASTEAKRAKRETSTKKTIFDLQNTALRPREEVVAEIKAERSTAAAGA
ncbi:MAG: hypothetical protein IPG83_02310 [Novosphingobium sp.]|nr:hypothetical protein [Novosphingobium sp.]